MNSPAAGQGSITKPGHGYARRLLFQRTGTTDPYRPGPARPGKTMHDRWALALATGNG